MALYIPHSIFHLERLLHVRPETFGPYYVSHREDSNKGQLVKAVWGKKSCLLPESKWTCKYTTRAKWRVPVPTQAVRGAAIGFKVTSKYSIFIISRQLLNWLIIKCLYVTLNFIIIFLYFRMSAWLTYLSSFGAGIFFKILAYLKSEYYKNQKR